VLGSKTSLFIYISHFGVLNFFFSSYRSLLCRNKSGISDMMNLRWRRVFKKGGEKILELMVKS